MWHTKCGNDEKTAKCQKLCPVSLGLAIGIVSFFAVLIWSLWVMKYGMPPMLAAMHIPVPTLSSGFGHALLALLKGFIFGFFVALFYDLIACCIACITCKKTEEKLEISSTEK